MVTKAREGLRLAICIWAIAGASILGSSATQASATAGAGAESIRGLDDPYAERSLLLSVGRHPEVHKRVLVRATGVAPSPLELSVYADPRGEACPATPSAQGRDARTIVSGLSVEGDFRVEERLRMKSHGRHSFCGYLSAGDGSQDTTSFTARKVRRPLLPAPRARRTVAAALRKHDFADRVVENLNRDCNRRNRATISCSFSSSFPGYRLTGHGQVRMGRHLSYRFRVEVGDLRVVLTDENEGRFPS